MEVLISSFVLAIGLVAIMALIAGGLKNSFESRDTIIAVGLVQEGAELVRNVRDNDFAAGGNGFARFSGQRHCRIDYRANVNDNLDCSVYAGSTSRYGLQYTGGFYEHGGSGRFSRYVYIEYNGTDAATVRSFVYWGGGASGMFMLSDVGDTGNAARCIAAKKCVFTEIKLESWK